MRRRILAILVPTIALLLVAAGCNKPPVASFTALPLSGQAPLVVSFDASGSVDPDGSIVSYAWSFGDDGSSSGITTNHTYNSDGSYTAWLTVTDDNGATGSANQEIQVSSIPPESFSLMTWNVQFYPENDSYPERGVWFTNTIADLDADILCIQEINGTAHDFIQREYVASGFLNNTSDSMDNAVFFSSDVTASDRPDPSGFQHPAQSAFFQIAGLAGYVVTFHLTWTDTTQRANERVRLVEVVSDYLALDPDLIIAGDFNTTGASGDSIEELAASTGLIWIEPTNYSVGTSYTGAVYDHILVSPSVAAAWDISATIITFADEAMSQDVSDHRPVYATFNEK